MQGCFERVKDLNWSLFMIKCSINHRTWWRLFFSLSTIRNQTSFTRIKFLQRRDNEANVSSLNSSSFTLTVHIQRLRILKTSHFRFVKKIIICLFIITCSTNHWTWWRLFFFSVYPLKESASSRLIGTFQETPIEVPWMNLFHHISCARYLAKTVIVTSFDYGMHLRFHFHQGVALFIVCGCLFLAWNIGFALFRKVI